MANQNRAMYELLYVVNTVLNDDQINDICDRVAGYIRDNDGEVIEEDRWGSRRLAYPIEKKRNGYYGIVYFRSGPQLIARLDRALRINDDILRHLVLRYDAKMERHFEQRKTDAAKRAEAAEATAESEGTPAAEPPAAETPAAETPAAEAPAAEAPEVETPTAETPAEAST
jgi:small subunit ribosomal protein S6